jgi:hypothetical protein
MMKLLLPLLACSNEPARESQPAPPAPPDPPAWDAEAEPLPCHADDPAPLLDQALADAGITREQLGFDEETWQGASYAPVLDDPFRLPWYRDLHWDPMRIPCEARQLAADLDHAAATPHPVATALGEAMARLGAVPGGEPIDPSTASQDLADLSELPAALGDALIPILAAIAAAGDARDEMAAAAPNDIEDLVASGSGGAIVDFDVYPDLTSTDVQDWVLGPAGPRRLYDPARALAFAVEEADLGRFAGMDISFEATTDRGRVIVAGPGDDAPGDIGNVALYLDLGGNDTYVHPTGASNVRVPASVHVDLGGDDVYGYVPTDEGTATLLPADEGGRYQGDAYYGGFSLSNEGRQGSGRFGVGLSFDLGAGDDQYQTLRMGQGWAHLGVGVLYDDGGSDVYLGEAGVQGGASMGIGMLLDAGDGADTRRTFTMSQGFAYVQAVGIAWDGGGDDTWYADPGDPAHGGEPVYYTPQLPGTGQNTFSQGAGFGRRDDATGGYLSGGLGVLRDLAGNDAYTASVFAQGTGYWQSTGWLLDGAGADTYDANWYVQGGAAHYSIGALIDDGPGDDVFEPTLTPHNVLQGSGHDFSVGILLNAEGDDSYTFGTLAQGTSNCQGIGIFADADGADTRTAASEYAVGLGNHSTECEDATRTLGRSTGIFLDSGGDIDSWTWPVGVHPVPADGATFGFEWTGTPDEHGGAVDGDGATGLF